MEQKITRRPATEEDAEFARAVHHEAFRDVVEKQFGEWDDRMQDDFFKSDWTPGQTEIIYNDAEPCGYVYIIRDPDKITLQELVVSPKFKGKGIGTKVLEEVIAESKETGLPVKLEVLKENKAQDLYRRYGFKDKETTETHFEMEFNPKDGQ